MARKFKSGDSAVISCYDQYLSEGEHVTIIDHHQGNIYIVEDANKDRWFITASHLKAINLTIHFFKYSDMFKNFFKCHPLSFRERREIVKRKWARYGYMQRPEHSKTLLTIADRLNTLMIAT